MLYARPIRALKVARPAEPLRMLGQQLSTIMEHHAARLRPGALRLPALRVPAKP